jgi:hypothetical protein
LRQRNVEHSGGRAIRRLDQRLDKMIRHFSQAGGRLLQPEIGSLNKAERRIQHDASLRSGGAPRRAAGTLLVAPRGRGNPPD